MTDAELRALVDAAQARYDALSPSQRLRHDYMQRRSFVRGMCPEEREYLSWCDLVDETMPHERDLTDTEIVNAACAAIRSLAVAQPRAPKVRTSHHRNKEETARLQALVDKRCAQDVALAVSRLHMKEAPTMDDVCQFCGTVPNASDPHSCKSQKEAVTVTAKWPGGCPWFDADSRKRFARQPVVPKGMSMVYVKQWRTIIMVPNGVVERAKALLCPQEGAVPHD